MRVPQKLEATELLIMRFDAALVDVYNQLSVARGEQEVPSGLPKHVFDFLDGTRLIISREILPSGHEVLHVSASNPRLSARELELIAQSHYLALSGKIRPMQIIGVTPGRVMHFYTETPEGTKKI